MTVEVFLHLPDEDEQVIIHLDPASVPRVGETVAWLPSDTGYLPVTEVGWALDRGGVQIVHVTVEREG